MKVTSNRHWRCPQCNARLEKGALGIAVFPGEDATVVQGTATCGSCAAVFSQSDVYGGRYDSPNADPDERVSDAAAASTPVATDPSGVVGEIEAGIEAIERACSMGLSGADQPLRPTGVNVLVFEIAKREHYRRHTALLTHLLEQRLLRDLKVWKLDVEDGRFAGLLVLVGDAHALQWYVKSAYYLDAAEAFVRTHFGGDWPSIEPTRSATDTPWIGCAMKLAESRQGLRNVASVIAPKAAGLVPLADGRGLRVHTSSERKRTSEADSRRAKECDLCSGQIVRGARTYSPLEIRMAVAVGLRPQAFLNGIGDVAQRSMVEKRWVKAAMTSETDWLACQTCEPEVEGKLNGPAKPWLNGLVFLAFSWGLLLWWQLSVDSTIPPCPSCPTTWSSTHAGLLAGGPILAVLTLIVAGRAFVQYQQNKILRIAQRIRVGKPPQRVAIDPPRQA